MIDHLRDVWRRHYFSFGEFQSFLEAKGIRIAIMAPSSIVNLLELQRANPGEKAFLSDQVEMFLDFLHNPRPSPVVDERVIVRGAD